MSTLPKPNMAHTRDHLLKLAALMLAACSGEDNSSSGQQAMVAPPLPPAVAAPRAPFYAPPFAHDDQAIVEEDSFVLITVLSNDVETQLATDPESILVVTDPQGGRALIGPSGLVLYIPDPDFYGTDSFQYTVDNIAGQTSNAATCFITINGVCDAPAAADDTVTTDTNGAVTVDFTANDSDPDGPIQVASLQFISSPAGGAATFDPVTKTIAYLANHDYQGDDTFTCQYTDDCGADSNPFDVTVHVVTLEPPSDLAYADNPAVYYEGLTITPNVPTYEGDVASSFSCDRQLPAGLSLDIITGVISGTPSELVGIDNYRIIASNAGGSTETELSLRVTQRLIANPPQDGERLTPNAPEVTSFFPGNGAHQETPIVLIFSESMDPAGVEEAFELIQQSPDPNIPDLPGIPLPGVLVGEGRVAILTPIVLIPSSSYQVGLREDASLTDRTGLLYDAGPSGIVGSFSVSANPNPTPQLLTMWPEQGSVDQSTLPEIVAIFDRAMYVWSVIAGGAFSVTVNGAPPTNNPSASVLSVPQSFGTVVTIPQVYTWRSFEPSGEPALLGLDAEISLALSSSIMSEDGELYASSSESFTTTLVNPPASVAITSIPTDAFGMNHVNGTTPLEVTVTLEDVSCVGDLLTLYAYGASETPGILSLLTREVSLTPGATFVTLGESELDFVDDSFNARFEDGDVYIAASLRRGSARSPVRLLDTDPLESGPQPAVLDTVPPVLVGLGTDGTQITDYVSTSSGLPVVGLAEEELAAVEVEVLLDGVLYTNGSLTPVIEANEAGAFIAKRLDLGIVDPAYLPAVLTVTIYDRAMNPALPLNLNWRQVGASGPGAALPGGGDVLVRVFDSATNQAVSGALIFSHQVDVVETFLNSAVTDAGGAALVPSAAVGATVITVEAAGYDLFTFHGVPTTRLDVPLQLTEGSGRIIYSVFSDVSELADPSVQVRVADDRLLSGPTQAVSCTDSPFGVLCGFPSADITAGRFGASTLLATVDQGIDFAAADFLKVADLEVLTGAVAPNAKMAYNYEVTGLLSDIGVDVEERPILAPPSSLDLFSLVSFDATSFAAGSPSVLIEGAVPSLGGVATVGAGVAEDFLGLGLFVVQGAYAGAADGIIDGAGDLEGRWVTEGLVEADLFFRVDLEDTSGNKSGRRMRFSELDQVVTIAPPDVPVLVSPAFNTGGSAFQLEFMDTLDDTQDGLFRVHMTDDNGRSWDVWHLNEPGFGQSITANVPEIASLGGQPLVDGQLEVVVSLRGVPSGDFDAGSFLWRTILEQADSRADTAHITLQQ